MKHEFERYCKDYENIENYERAKKDNFKGWHCHHRLETHNSDGARRLVNISVEELEALGMYYNRPASELIFMKHGEHSSLHDEGVNNPMYGMHHSEESRKKISEGNKGKHLSEETKKKLSEAHKGKQAGENHPMYGKHHSEETRKKIGESSKGKKMSEEAKKKIAEAKKGKHWYNNGKENKYCFECPDGFVPGRLFTNINKGN